MQKKSLKKEIIENLVLAGVMFAFVFLIGKFVIINAKIPSESMQNTIMVHDRIFGNRLAYKKNGPKRYDIIIFKYPDNESVYYIKRVIGLPGDTIDIRDGHVYINDEEQPAREDFCPEAGVTDEGEMTFPITVPQDAYFVLGDNRENSADSRYWENHFVSKDKILAKAVFRYWPFTKIGKI